MVLQTRLNPWNYDIVLRYWEEYLEEFKEKVKRSIGRKFEVKRTKRRLETYVETALIQRDQEFLEFDETTSQLVSAIDAQTQGISHAIQNFEHEKNVIKSSRPILIGPATLESLLNQQPESYEYIRTEKLPFDAMFFEFQEPFKLGIPLRTEVMDITGMSFYKLAVHGCPDATFVPQNAKYGITLYYREARRLVPVRLYMDSSNMDVIAGSVHDKRFLINTSEGTLSYNTPYDDSTFPEPGTWLNQSKIEGREDLAVFYQIANLCTNLINYINAQNVTVVKRERKVEAIIRTEKNKKKKVEFTEPYYIIRIQRQEIEEPQTQTGRSWELRWRVYVRGHNRRYRNREGEIYMTIWIEPHVKGPPDAQWRYSRYVLLAHQLEQEKLWYKKYGA